MNGKPSSPVLRGLGASDGARPRDSNPDGQRAISTGKSGIGEVPYSTCNPFMSDAIMRSKCSTLPVIGAPKSMFSEPQKHAWTPLVESETCESSGIEVFGTSEPTSAGAVGTAGA
jgi:hypothetical protein